MGHLTSRVEVDCPLSAPRAVTWRAFALSLNPECLARGPPPAAVQRHICGVFSNKAILNLNRDNELTAYQLAGEYRGAFVAGRSPVLDLAKLCKRIAQCRMHDFGSLLRRGQSATRKMCLR